jgi:hypothetical protein
VPETSKMKTAPIPRFKNPEVKDFRLGNDKLTLNKYY